MESAQLLTTTELLAGTQNALVEAGYELVDDLTAQPLYDGSRLLQNQYSVVMIGTFVTWESLAESWADYQNLTVELMATFLRKGEAKAADGYLVLLTPSPVPAGEIAVANRIRADTSRLRKLLGTADTLRTISDVRKVIASLLPISFTAGERSSERSLNALPRVLEQHGIQPAVTNVLVDAFTANAPIMPRLHDFQHPR